MDPVALTSDLERFVLEALGEGSAPWLGRVVDLISDSENPEKVWHQVGRAISQKYREEMDLESRFSFGFELSQRVDAYAYPAAYSRWQSESLAPLGEFPGKWFWDQRSIHYENKPPNEYRSSYCLTDPELDPILLAPYWNTIVVTDRTSWGYLRCGSFLGSANRQLVDQWEEQACLTLVAAHASHAEEKLFEGACFQITTISLLEESDPLYRKMRSIFKRVSRMELVLDGTVKITERAIHIGRSLVGDRGSRPLKIQLKLERASSLADVWAKCVRARENGESVGIVDDYGKDRVGVASAYVAAAFVTEQLSEPESLPERFAQLYQEGNTLKIARQNSEVPAMHGVLPKALGSEKRSSIEALRPFLKPCE